MPETFSGKITITNAAGTETMSLNGTNGDLIAGGNGVNGDVMLRDTAGNNRIVFNPNTSTITIKTAAGLDVVTIGPNGNITIGTTDIDGDIVLKDNAGRNRIEIGADEQRMLMKDTAGVVVGTIGSSGNLRLGSHGCDGDILLYPASAADQTTDAAATIHLDADAGDIILRNADCAEEFDVTSEEDAEPGTVMVFGDDGRLMPCTEEYDYRVAGVLSCAGDYRPGLVLDKKPSVALRKPLALMGKVFCKADASFGAIKAGDLLTTSPVAGYAMKVQDKVRAYGAVIGKALKPLSEGRGLVPLLVTLQ